MLKKRKKRDVKAQFYLVATIIIVSLFLSFVAVLNYSIKRDNLIIYDLAEELNIEGGRVLDYEQKTGESVFENDFAKSYSYYVGNNRDIYFVYGEIGDIKGFRYNGENKVDLNPDEEEGKATIEVQGNEYEFELQPGQNFYFVMAEESKGQEYFITNQ
jgi:hypothetical protein